MRRHRSSVLSKKYTSLIFLIVFLIFQQSCSFILRTVLSEPKAEGASNNHNMFQAKDLTRLSGPYRNVQFETPALDIAVEAKNAQPVILSFGVWVLPVIPWPPGFINLFRLPRDAPPPLWFEVLFNPKTEGITFDPMAVSLETSDGVHLSPLGFLGPFYGTRNKIRWPCDWFQERDSPLKKTVDSSIDINQWSCMRIAFNVNPSPANTFSFSIKGLRKNQEVLPTPSIIFKKQISWEFFSLF